MSDALKVFSMINSSFYYLLGLKVLSVKEFENINCQKIRDLRLSCQAVRNNYKLMIKFTYWPLIGYYPCNFSNFGQYACSNLVP